MSDRDELFEQIYEAITKDGLTWIEKSEAAADAILASGWADRLRAEGYDLGYMDRDEHDFHKPNRPGYTGSPYDSEVKP